MEEQGEVTFERWRERFLRDAERCGRLHNAQQLSDDVLRLFWGTGVAPSVLAVTKAGEEAKAS